MYPHSINSHTAYVSVVYSGDGRVADIRHITISDRRIFNRVLLQLFVDRHRFTASDFCHFARVCSHSRSRSHDSIFALATLATAPLLVAPGTVLKTQFDLRMVNPASDHHKDTLGDGR